MYYSNKVGGYSILATAFMVYNKHHPLVVSTPISCTPNHTVTYMAMKRLWWSYILIKRLWCLPYTVVVSTPSTLLSSYVDKIFLQVLRRIMLQIWRMLYISSFSCTYFLPEWKRFVWWSPLDPPVVWLEWSQHHMVYRALKDWKWQQRWIHDLRNCS